jgi:hypothetical protein
MVATRLRVVPVSFKDACGFVTMWHRHHQAPIGHKFSLGVADEDDLLRGVAIVGRPVARMLQDGLTLEVTRTATDGTANANSMLYGAAWKAAKALGYRRLITYTQAGESGSSLRGAGWRVIAELSARTPARSWNAPSRPRNVQYPEGIPRTLWEAGGDGDRRGGHQSHGSQRGSASHIAMSTGSGSPPPRPAPAS